MSFDDFSSFFQHFVVFRPFPVPSCSFLASSLCDLLYRFEELCSINENLVPMFSCTKLRKAIDDFHYDIVKRLNMVSLTILTMIEQKFMKIIRFFVGKIKLSKKLDTILCFNSAAFFSSKYQHC